MKALKIFAWDLYFVSLLLIFFLNILVFSFQESNNYIIRSSGKIVTISPLHVEGRYLKDYFNRTIILRGVNKGQLDDPNDWWNPEGGGLYSGLRKWDPEAVKFNLNKMSEWGCNALRIHTSIKWWLFNEQNYRQHIRDIIQWAGERGIYVIFEPFSIVGADQYALPWGDYIPPEQREIMPNSTAFINYWKSVVNELKDMPNVIFEFYNEPGCRTDSTYPEINITEFFNVVQEWIRTVREAGAAQPLLVQLGGSLNTHVISFEDKTAYYIDGLQWVEEYPLTDPINNVIYGFHWYRGAVLKTESGTTVRCWEYDELKNGMEICFVRYVLENLSKPLLVGEVGANLWWTEEELERELAFFNNTLRIFEEWGISYAAFTWTVPEHNRYGLLKLTNDKWYCEPNVAGEILINIISESKK